MRVLITNSLLLAAISLVPSASAAPQLTASSVDPFEAHIVPTALAQDPGAPSVPSMLYPYGRTIHLSHRTLPLDVRRDEVIHVESLYDESPFGNIFGPLARAFDIMGMNAFSENMPLTEAQKTFLDTLRDNLGVATDNVVARLPAKLPLSPLPSRSLEDHQFGNPLTCASSLSVLGDPFARLSQFVSSVVGANPPDTLTDAKKQAIAKIQAAIDNGILDASDVLKLTAGLPLNHARSVEQGSLENLFAKLRGVPLLGTTLQPVTDFVEELGVLGAADGSHLSDIQKQGISEIQAAVAKVAQMMEDRVPDVHIQHTREEHQRWDHNDHQPHHEHNPGDHSRDAHKDDQNPRDQSKDRHMSPDTRTEDRSAHGHGREGDHCWEPRDGQWRKSDNCGHHNDGKDWRGDSSLLNINLGHGRRA